MANHHRKILTLMGEWVAHPLAFLLVAAYGVTWVLRARDTFDYAAGAAMITWFITMFIKRSEHRDDEAMNAKLDELLRITIGSNKRLIGIDSDEVEDVVEFRNRGKGKRS